MTTNPRGRDLTQRGPGATRKAAVPSIPEPGVSDQRRFNEAVKEVLEVREGIRGSGYDRFVSWRDLAELGIVIGDFRGARFSTRRPDGAGGVVIQAGNGTYASISVEDFAEGIRNTRLYRDLMKRLDDPTRFDDLPAKIRQILLVDIANEAKTRGADIQRLEKKIQSTEESMAVVVDEVTAAVENAVAGVRQSAFAYAEPGRAAAGIANQVKVRLDDVDGQGVTIEELMYGSASNAGLLGQYTLKIQAGGALAGFGLAAEDVDGATSSAFLIAADKFAIVSPTYSGGLTSTPSLANIPFGVDASGVYIKGQVRINAGGSTLDDLTSDTGVYLSYDTQFFKYDATGAAINSTITLTANLTGGLTGYVDWDVVSGYSGSLPADGTTNTATISLANMTGDAATFQITKVDGATTYTDTVSLVKLRDGSNALTGILTNEAHTIPTNADGSGANYTGAGGTFQVYRGTTLLASPAVSFSYVTSSGFSSAPSASINSATGVYSISGNMSADVATVTYRATVGTTTIDKVFTLTRSKQGNDGEAGSNTIGLTLLPTTQVFRIAKDGTATPSVLTITAQRQNSTATVSWSTSPVITGINGTTGTSITLYPRASDTTPNMGSNNAVTITATMTDGVTIQDKVTIVRVYEGSDAVTAVLSNESHAVPANSDGSSPNFTGASTQMSVFVGATDDSSNWTYTTSAVGVTITGANTRSVTITGMTGDTGYVDITASKSGYSSITKRFTLAKTKQGAAGARGSLTGQTSVSTLIRWTARTGGKAQWASTSGTEANAVTIDNAARDRIWVMLGNSGSAPDNSHLRIGDTVTVTNAASGATAAVTGYWSGTAWLNPGVMIDGNLLVSGTVSASVLTAGTMSLPSSNGIGTVTLQDLDGGTGVSKYPLIVERQQTVGGLGFAGMLLKDSATFSGPTNSPLLQVIYNRYGIQLIPGAGATGNSAAIQMGSGAGVLFQSMTGPGIRVTQAVSNGDDAITGTGNSGAGIRGSAVSGYGGHFTGNTTKPPLKLDSSASKPSDASTGGVMVYNDGGGFRLCLAVAGTWYKIDAPLTAI